MNLLYIVFFLLGVMVGAGGCYWYWRGRLGGGEAVAAQRQLARYREQVADHFATTATQVNQMTDAYKAVFDHLQKGALELLDENTLRERLAAAPGGRVILDRLGQVEHDKVAKAKPDDASQAIDDIDGAHS